MDPLGDSALSVNPISNVREWNTYSLKVDTPIIGTDFTDKPSVISEVTQNSLEKLSYNVIPSNREVSDINQLNNSIDPFWNAIKKRSKYKYSREYYDIKIIDTLFDVVSNSKIVAFTPAYNQYFDEKQLTVKNVLINMSDEELTSTYDDELLNSIGGGSNISVIYEEFWNFDSIHDRWEKVNNLGKFDLLVHVENSSGRDGYESKTKPYPYDSDFLEPCTKGLNLLNDNGNSIIQIESYGSRYIADLIYLYAYLFDSVSVIKPSSTNPISHRHYVIGKSFNRNKYDEIKDKLDILLIKLFSYSVQNVNNAYNRSKQIFNGSFIENTEKDVNFISWMMDINDKLGVLLFTNLLSLRSAIDDRRFGFTSGHPYYLYDHTSYRESLGFKGRNTLKHLPNMKFSDELEIEETTQSQFKPIVLSKHVGLGENFKRYYILIHIIKGIVNIGYSHISDEITQYVKNWVGILMALGDLDKLLTLSNDENYYINIIKSRNWTIKDIYVKQSILKTYKSQQVLELIANIFKSGAIGIQNTTLNSIYKVKIIATPLKNLRFKLSFGYNSTRFAIMQDSIPGVIGEYEIMNLMTVEERNQVENVIQLTDIMKNQSFLTRVANSICLNVLVSSDIFTLSSCISVPDLYFKYKPDIEAFASPANHYAPIWCSANDEDKQVGSMGNFFGKFSQKDNIIFDKYKSMIVFPPINRDVALKAIVLCLDILNHRKAGDFSIIFITESGSNYIGEIDIKIMASRIKSKSIPLNRIYYPFSGKSEFRKPLKAYLLSTDNPTFGHL